MKLNLAKLVGSRIQTDGKDLVDLVDAQVIKRNEGLVRLAVPKTRILFWISLSASMDMLTPIHLGSRPMPFIGLGFL